MSMFVVVVVNVAIGLKIFDVNDRDKKEYANNVWRVNGMKMVLYELGFLLFNIYKVIFNYFNENFTNIRFMIYTICNVLWNGKYLFINIVCRIGII